MRCVAGEVHVDGVWFTGDEIGENSTNIPNGRLLPNTCSGPDVKVWLSKKKGRMCGCIRTASELYEPDVCRELLAVEEMEIQDDQENFKMIPPEMASFLKLRILTLKWTMLKFLTPSLTSLKLTHLYMPHNRLVSIEGITAMRTLIVLDVSVNLLLSLPDDIGNLQTLKELVVSGNKLKELPETITSCRHLAELTVASNKLTALPETIGRLTRLKVLDASMNLLTSLPDSIGDLENLLDLRASGNRLWQLPATLRNATAIRSLTFRRNRLHEVPYVLCFLQHLQMLNLRDNLIEEIDGVMVQLKYLLLDANRLSNIPPAVLKCEKLEVLSLENNRLEDIPASIANLTNLRALYVGHNQIEHVPPEIGNLEQLRHLALEYNPIQSLPSDFELLKRLSVLNLEYTNMDGSWMAAYRQGVPAVLEYANSVRHVRKESVSGLSTNGQGKRPRDKLPNPRLTPPASPDPARGWPSQQETVRSPPGTLAMNGRRSPSPISVFESRGRSPQRVLGTPIGDYQPHSLSRSSEPERARSPSRASDYHTRTSIRASVEYVGSLPRYPEPSRGRSPITTYENVGLPRQSPPPTLIRIGGDYTHSPGASPVAMRQTLGQGNHVPEWKQQSYVLETRKKRLARVVGGIEETVYDDDGPI